MMNGARVFQHHKRIFLKLFKICLYNILSLLRNIYSDTDIILLLFFFLPRSDARA